MCESWESHESYVRCELVRQLGVLYEKELRMGKEDPSIGLERRAVSERLMAGPAFHALRRAARAASLCAARE